MLIAVLDKRWIHAFPKNISVKRNVNNFIQDLNSSLRVYDDNRCTMIIIIAS